MDQTDDVQELSTETIRLRHEVASLKRQNEAQKQENARLVAGFGRREIMREAEAAGAFNSAQIPALLGNVSHVWQGDMPEPRIDVEGIGPQTVRDAIAGLRKTAPNMFRDAVRKEIQRTQGERPDPAALKSQEEYRRQRQAFGLTGRPGR